jgi:ABC-2 type transport system permease protein
MHIRSILAVARKDALDILLNKTTLFLLLTPILLSLVFYMITALIGSHNTTILVYNPGQSGVVQVVSASFSDSQVVQANSAADVAAAFGPNGAHKNSSYAIGMVIPANFDANLRAGKHLPLSLFINGDDVGTQQSLLVQTAINNYARSVATPQPPIRLATTTINPPSDMNIGVDVGRIYAVTALLVSFLVGTSLIPTLLIEEKEKKTMRMLMVSPASFTDVILGKLLVVLVYQLVLSGVVLAIEGGYTGQISLVLLYTLLGSCFGLALGLLFGSIFQTASAAGAVGGIVSFIYILPGLFVGLLGQLLGNGFVTQLIKILPTYYIADGAYNAIENLGSFSGNLLDISVTLGSTIILLMIAVWALRRQAAVAGTI